MHESIGKIRRRDEEGVHRGCVMLSHRVVFVSVDFVSVIQIYIYIRLQFMQIFTFLFDEESIFGLSRGITPSSLGTVSFNLSLRVVFMSGGRISIQMIHGPTRSFPKVSLSA